MNDDNHVHDWLRPRLPRNGKIRLGIKKKSKRGNPYPSETSYFVFDEDLEGREDIVKAHGEKPDRLLVMLPNDSVRAFFPIARKLYSKSFGVICRGNNRKASRRTFVIVKEGQNDKRRAETDANGKPKTEQVDCPCPFAESQGGKPAQCKVIGNLMVILPYSNFRTYQIDTSSWHSMNDLTNDHAHLMMLHGGSLIGRPVWLTRRKKETHASGRTETHYTLRFERLTPEEMKEHTERLNEILGIYHKPMVPGLSSAEVETPLQLPMGSEEYEEEQILDDDRVGDDDLPTSGAIDLDDVGGDEPEGDPEKPRKKKTTRKAKPKGTPKPEPEEETTTPEEEPSEEDDDLDLDF